MRLTEDADGPHAPAWASGVSSFQIDFLTSDEVLSLSVCHVCHPTLFTQPGRPAPDGLFDPRMGAFHANKTCATCSGTQETCHGHFGHVRFAFPLFHLHHADLLGKVLRLVCHNCGEVPLFVNDPRLVSALRIKALTARISALERAASCASCPHCGAARQKVRARTGSWTSSTTLLVDGSEVSHSFVLARLRSIRPDVAAQLGFRPERRPDAVMVVEVAPVLPPCGRESHVDGRGSRGEDSLTDLYQELLVANAQAEEAVQRFFPASVFSDRAARLQKAYDRVLLTISKKRLDGKAGRLRQNIQGKRVNFSARAVISPDPFIAMYEVGIPRSVAATLTKPVPVTRHNVGKYNALLSARVGEHGIRRILKTDGRRYELEGHAVLRPQSSAQEGDILEVSLQDGDWVLMNRNPSLEKVSAMAQKVKILDGSTFRINPITCTPYNADFDGDEMNLHACQAFEAEAEMAFLANAALCGASNSAPRCCIYKATQDTLLGAALLTSKDVFLPKADAMQLAMEAWSGREEGRAGGELPPPAVLKPEQLWTGAQMVSLLLPAWLWHEAGAVDDGGQDEDDAVVVQGGALLSGRLAKRTIGGGPLLGEMEETAAGAASLFLASLQRLVVAWMRECVSFSIGMGDLDLPPAGARAVAAARADALAASRSVSLLRPPRGSEDEATVTAHLTAATAKAHAAALSSLSWSNALYAMTQSGSKGSSLNLLQITGMLGQQNCDGEPAVRESLRSGRSLPHFLRGDLSPAARGFVVESYRDGLSPANFFFHAMAGREGLIDTAKKTSVAGYLTRRLVSAMQDLVVAYDGTVRGSGQRVIQFRYNDDGADATCARDSCASILKRRPAGAGGKTAEDAVRAGADVGASVPFLVEEAILDEERALRARGPRPPPDHLPAQAEEAGAASAAAPAAVQDAVDAVDAVAERLGEPLFGAALRLSLPPSRVASSASLCDRSFLRSVLSRVEQQARKGKIVAGTAAGVVAAQSIGAPATQMTLNTFHHAGRSSSTVEQGIPRMDQMLRLGSPAVPPVSTLFLRPRRCADPDAAAALQARLQQVLLKDLLLLAECWYDPDTDGSQGGTAPPEDAAVVLAHYELPDEDGAGDGADAVEDESGEEEEEEAGARGARGLGGARGGKKGGKKRRLLSPWVIRLCLDARLLATRRLAPSDVCASLARHIGTGALQTVCSDDNDPFPVLRLRIVTLDDEEGGSAAASAAAAAGQGEEEGSREGGGGDEATSDHGTSDHVGYCGAMPTVKHNWFVCTHNNFTDDDSARFMEFSQLCSYFIMGAETAPTTGTHHLQIAFWFTPGATLSNMKRKLKGTAVFTSGKKKPPAYWKAYCSKEDTDAYEHGELPSLEDYYAQIPKGQGSRADLISVKHGEARGDEGAALSSWVCRTIGSTRVAGLPGVSASVRKVGREWVVDAQGGEKGTFLSLLGDVDVDFARTRTNDAITAQQVLGVEAARQTLIDEIGRVMEADGGRLHAAHAKLLADTMTQGGVLRPLTRYGVVATDGRSALDQASFEQTSAVLARASQDGRKEALGISGRICVGQMGRFGSGMTDMLLNVSMASAAAVEREEREASAAAAAAASLLERERASPPSFSPWRDDWAPDDSPYVPSSPSRDCSAPSFSPSHDAYDPEDGGCAAFFTAAPRPREGDDDSGGYDPASGPAAEEYDPWRAPFDF